MFTALLVGTVVLAVYIHSTHTACFVFPQTDFSSLSACPLHTSLTVASHSCASDALLPDSYQPEAVHTGPFECCRVSTRHAAKALLYLCHEDTKNNDLLGVCVNAS